MLVSCEKAINPGPDPAVKILGLDRLEWDDGEADARRCEQTTEAKRNCFKQCATKTKRALAMLHPVSVARCYRIFHDALGAGDRCTCSGHLLNVLWG